MAQESTDFVLSQMNQTAKDFNLKAEPIPDIDKVDESDYADLDDTCPSSEVQEYDEDLSYLAAGDFQQYQCPLSAGKLSKEDYFKSDVYTRLYENTAKRTHRCSTSSQSGSEGRRGSNGGGGKSNPLSISNPAPPEDPYEIYVASEEFLLESPIVAIKKCANLAIKSNAHNRAFWTSHQNELFKFIDEGQILPLKMIMNELKIGVKNAASFMNGLYAGLAISKTQEAKNLIAGLGQLVDSMRVSHQEAREEAAAHQKQTVEFIHQLSQASETVAGFQRAVEKVKLASLRLDVSPAPLPKSDILEKLPELGGFSSPSSIADVAGTPVQKLDSPGTYVSPYLTVKIGDPFITSIDIHVPEMRSLQFLIGKNRSFGYQVLNRSLDDMRIRGAESLVWLSSVVPKEPSGDRTALIKTLKSIPLKYYQWTRKDVDPDNI